MGYAGYAPGNQVAEPLSDLEQALRSIPDGQASDVLELLERLLRNVVQAPLEEKFRKIRLANEKIAQIIGSVPVAVEALLEIGWVKQCVDEEEVLILPPEAKLDFPNHINKVLEAKDYFQKLHTREKANQKAAMRFAAAAEDELERAGVMQHFDRGAMDPVWSPAVERPTEASHPDVAAPVPVSLRELRAEQGIAIPARSSRGSSQPAPRTRSLSCNGSKDGRALILSLLADARTLPSGVSGPGRPAVASKGSALASRPFGANVHTLSSAPASSSGSSGARASSCGVAGSRLQQTTEAYRQQRGTTARTVGQVGRATMTAEKEAEVMRARTKVLGAERAAVGRPASASKAGVSGTRPPMPPASRRASGSGHQLGRA